jgi:signal transduction histidine kinase
MSLARKTLYGVIGTVAVSTILLYVLSQLTLLNGYKHIEQDDMRRNVQRTVEGFENQSYSLVLSARAYAVWDDMYNFVEHPDPAFIEYLGLTLDVHVTHHANLIAILDDHHQIAFLQLYDLAARVPLDVPADLRAQLQPDSPLVNHTSDQVEKSGLILVNGQPMEIASLACLHTDFTGDPRGAVIFGRFIDQPELDALAAAVKLPVAGYLLNDPGLPRDVREARDRLLAQDSAADVVVKALDGDTIAGYTLLRTIDQQPAFLLRVEMERQIYAQGRTSFRYFALWIGLMGVLFILVSIFLLHRHVLGPLTLLSQQISHIRASGDSTLRLEVRGQDELASLGQTINGMLASLESHTLELSAARDKALNAERLKSQFLARMSHELRTPLNAILNFTQFVSSGMYGPVNEKQVSALQKTTYSARHLLALINDVLDMSKIEADRLDLALENDLDLVPELEAVAATTRTLLEDKPVEIVCDFAPNLPHLTGDRRRLRQVLLNLTANAAKFTASGQITLRAWPDGDRVMIAVQDTGPGLSPEDLQIIFEPYRQAGHHASRAAGTGLGLPISYRLVEAHGGRLWVESQAGHGSTFYVSLPVMPVEGEREKKL